MTFFALELDPAAAAHLGFDEALGLLRSLCMTPFGREALDEAVFPSSASELEERLDEAMEAKSALVRKVTPPFADIREIRPHLAAVRKGVVLGAPDLVDVGRTVDALARLRDVLAFQGEAAPLLSARAGFLADERRFSRRILGAFDEQGLLKDDASPELATLRGRVRALREEATAQLDKLVRTFDQQGYLRDRNFTVRNDRYVLPVKSELQSLVEGIVHDASQTHHTVFIEPRALLELGNRIKIARSQAAEEEERILASLSAEVAERADTFAHDLELSGRLEATFARGMFAKVTDGQKPRILQDGDALLLHSARHPLLSFARGQVPDSPPLIENDIGLGDARVLVISGPNGGGKTVALTTAGLIVLLVRAGIPAPVAADSVVPCFARVVCAMAGDQSLQAGLSTFQSHLLELRRSLAEVGTSPGPVLCLVDEICSGTDPAEGAALAQAVLETLSERARVIVTTHFERLKILALDPERGGVFRNASFALSERTGQPTYRLILDQAGTSRALAAARDKGIPAAVLERAEALLSPDDKELVGTLRVLAEQKDAMRVRLEQLERDREELTRDSEKLTRRLDEVERESQRLRREGKKAFLDELKDARRTVAEAIEAAKGGAAPKELDRLSHELRGLEASTQEGAATPLARVAPLKVAVGDVVELAEVPGVRMSVLEVDGDSVVVGKGALKTRTTRDALRAPGSSGEAKKAARAQKKKSGPVPGAALDPRTADNSLDVRGQRADEALERVDAFLDRMMKEDRGRAFILHGHGGGSLKGAIRKALSSSRYVQRHQPADAEDGGDAWTVVTVSGA